MQVLKLTHTIVTIAECLRPRSWTSLFKRILYNIYSIQMIGILYVYSLFQFMDIVFNVNNTDVLTKTLNVMMCTSTSCYKIITMCLNYNDIVALIDDLTEEPFKPLDPDEMKIRLQYDKMIRNNTIGYIVLLIGSYSFFPVLTSFFTHVRHKRLQYKEWLLYDYSSNILIYGLTYIQQMLGGYYTSIINVAIDTLMCGFLMHICCQIEILESRLKKILSKQITLGYCVRHHNQIFEFAETVNVKFTKIIGLQFLSSMMMMCSLLYKMTKATLNLDYITLITFAYSILMEIFIYCWFGNQVKLKSLQLIDSIFQMNWPILDNSVKKSLLLIMKRAMTPIEISTIYVLTMNLDSFVMIIKTSYSIYNLLTKV